VLRKLAEIWKNLLTFFSSEEGRRRTFINRLVEETICPPDARVDYDVIITICRWRAATGP
jgi:hypothetical protein